VPTKNSLFHFFQNEQLELNTKDVNPDVVTKYKWGTWSIFPPMLCWYGILSVPHIVFCQNGWAYHAKCLWQLRGYTFWCYRCRWNFSGSAPMGHQMHVGKKNVAVYLLYLESKCMWPIKQSWLNSLSMPAAMPEWATRDCYYRQLTGSIYALSHSTLFVVSSSDLQGHKIVQNLIIAPEARCACNS